MKLCKLIYLIRKRIARLEYEGNEICWSCRPKSERSLNKTTSLALTERLIGSFSLVLSFIRQLTNQHASFNIFTLLSGNNIFSVNQNENNK